MYVSPHLPRQPDYSEAFSHYSYPPSPPMSSYFSAGHEDSSNRSLPTTQLNRVSLNRLTHLDLN